MKASFYTESILYWVAKRLCWLAQRLPPSLNAQIGVLVGTGFYYLLPRRCAVARGNLRAAFGNAHSPEDYDQIIRSLFQNLGTTLLEIGAIPSMDKNYVDRFIAPAPGSQERLDKALSKKKGVIFLASHFGNWEISTVVAPRFGYPMLVLAREQGWPKLNGLLTRYREMNGCRVVTKGFPIRELIRGLEQGKIVGILADQDGGKHGVLAPFLGRLASTAPGAVALSLETGAPLIPVFIIRRYGTAHTIVLEEPIQMPQSGSKETRVQAGIAAYLSVLERYVRRYPSQWLWLHRRWKSTPERRLLLFSDGKPGHSAQIEALAQRIGMAWEVRMKEDRRFQGRSDLKEKR